MCWAHPGHPSSAAGIWLMLRAEFETIPSADSAELGRTQVRVMVMDGQLLTALSQTPPARCTDAKQPRRRLVARPATGLGTDKEDRGFPRSRKPHILRTRGA